MSKLLREFISLPYNQSLVKEAIEKKKPILLQGIMQRADAKNQNGRIYPRNILDREVENYQKAVEEGRALGECDHPEVSIISLKNVSHCVREMHWENDDVCGTIEILNTPAGKIIQNLLEAGIKIGISSRGVGETEKTNEGVDMVKEDFVLIRIRFGSESQAHKMHG